MTLLRSLAMALSCFSRFLVPQVDWKPESMRYMMCFFPVVGVLIGVLLVLWAWLCGAAGFGAVLRGAGIVLIPIAVSGGIHMDGFVDTCDALASNAGPARRREILKDPHTGAFGAIGLGTYLVAALALASEPTAVALLPCLAAIPVLSRCLSGIATVAFDPGVGKGMLFEFYNSADRRLSLLVLVVEALACAVFAVAANPLAGVCMTVGALACLAGLHRLSDRAFGGMSGDLAGFFLQVSELIMLACIVVAGSAAGL